MVRPKKKLGQHFLTDPSIAERIVKSLETTENDVVVEIGPGKGILTGFLLERNIQLFAVEVDPESVEYLQDRWSDLSDRIICADVLKLDWTEHFPDNLHVIGNFPYNISSQIFFKILENRSRVQQVVCMLQKEVAGRLVSPPGNKEYGILSVLLGAFYELDYLFTVKPGSFFPAPKVQSAVIKLKRNSVDRLDCDEKLFFSTVKQAFNQRRKTIRNALRSKLLNLDHDWDLLSKRAEQLSVAEFVELTGRIQSSNL